jgi:signal transduction histidine kinase
MKILVIDDDEIALAVARRILENERYEVELAGDGEAALEILRSTDIQIVISDWNMPKITGIDLCHSLRAAPAARYIYIILVTARSSKEDMLLGLSAGADDFISKPFEPAELLVRVHNAERVLAMEMDLRQSERRNAALLSAVPDMMFRIRRDGVFLDYKASNPGLLVVPGEQIVGASIGAIMPEALVEKIMNCIEQALTTKEMQTLEYTLKIGDAAHVFEARFKDSGIDEVTAIVREISDRARLEQMKSDFINRATHELRTPIATMLLMVNLIDGDATAEEFTEYWNVLKSELSRERLLVEDLLSAGRLENNQFPVHFRFIDVTEILKITIRQLELLAKERNIRIGLQVSDDQDVTSHFINGDENGLTQVFVNLVGNAIKFSPAGGQVNIGLRSLNSGLAVTIQDSGIGIPSEDIPLLFNRFFRGSNAIENEIPGTGIGLFIVRSILEKHKGSIKVHSELGHGSQFDIWLPLNHQEA